MFGIAGEFKIWFYKFLTTEFRDNEPKTTIASPGRKQVIVFAILIFDNSAKKSVQNTNLIDFRNKPQCKIMKF